MCVCRGGGGGERVAALPRVPHVTDWISISAQLSTTLEVGSVTYARQHNADETARCVVEQFQPQQPKIHWISGWSQKKVGVIAKSSLTACGLSLQDV